MSERPAVRCYQRVRTRCPHRCNDGLVLGRRLQRRPQEAVDLVLDALVQAWTAACTHTGGAG